MRRTPEKRKKLLVPLEAEKGKRSLYEFSKLCLHIVEPGKSFIDGPHIRLVCNHLEAVYRGEIKNLCINLPPGHMKSLLVDVFFPVWVWLQDASQSFLSASYDATLTLRDASKSLTLVQSQWFRDRWGTRIRISKEAARGDYTNSEGGFRFSTSVGGKATGRHPNYIIVDDPTKPSECTKRNLDAVEDWWKGTIASRGIGNDVRKIVIMQRLHESDLSAICEKDGFVMLRLPFRYESEYPCSTKWGRDERTEDGELLWGERISEDEAKKLETDMGSRVSASQLQQRPSPEGGLIFQRDWIRYYTTPPESFEKIIQTWDLSFKDTSTSDFVVGQVWGRTKGDYYLLDQVRGRMGFTATVAAILSMSKKHPRAIAKLIEDKANGPAVITTLKGSLSGVVPVNPEGGKEARANAVTPLFEAGNVYFPKDAPYTQKLVDELLLFPNSANDDQVDALTQGLLYLYTKRSSFGAAMDAFKSYGRSYL